MHWIKRNDEMKTSSYFFNILLTSVALSTCDCDKISATKSSFHLSKPEDNEYFHTIGTSLKPVDSNPVKRIVNDYDDTFRNQNGYLAGSDSLQPQYQHSKASNNLVHPLVRKASAASVSLIYLLLAWRAMGCYDSISDSSASYLRTLFNIPVAFIFCLDIFGFIASLINPSRFKVVLKFILACNTVREITELAFNVLRIITISKTTGRDYYLGRMIASVYFLLLCFSTSRIRWIEQKQNYDRR